MSQPLAVAASAHVHSEWHAVPTMALEVVLAEALCPLQTVPHCGSHRVLHNLMRLITAAWHALTHSKCWQMHNHGGKVGH